MKITLRNIGRPSPQRLEEIVDFAIEQVRERPADADGPLEDAIRIMQIVACKEKAGEITLEESSAVFSGAIMVLTEELLYNINAAGGWGRCATLEHDA